MPASMADCFDQCLSIGPLSSKTHHYFSFFVSWQVGEVSMGSIVVVLGLSYCCCCCCVTRCWLTLSMLLVFCLRAISFGHSTIHPSNRACCIIRLQENVKIPHNTKRNIGLPKNNILFSICLLRLSPDVLVMRNKTTEKNDVLLQMGHKVTQATTSSHQQPPHTVDRNTLK